MLKNVFFVLGFSIFLLLTGCENDVKNETPPRPNTAVDVATAPKASVIDWHTYTTRLVPPKQVDLRPRVTGLITAVKFKEGDYVMQGDTLFTLDNRIYLATVKQLQARKKKAHAALLQAQSESKRAYRLQKKNAISAEEAEARTSITSQREAELAAIQSSLQLAKLNLEFTTVKSPITGKISRALFTEGNTVKANETLLTRIVSTGALYAYFDIDERSWNAQFSRVEDVYKLPVRLTIMGSQTPDQVGYIDFIDNEIDQKSGTLRVRAVFDNKAQALLAGSFARISLTTGINNEKIVVPDRAIGTDLKNRFVLVMDEDSVLQYRLVKLGKRYGKFRAIKSGLEEGDWIVVNGPAKVGAGMKVSPRKVALEVPKLVSDFAFAASDSSSNNEVL